MSNPDQEKVERRINAHLDAIDRALAAKGVPFSERRSITADVEAHIKEMLASAGENPTEGDIEAVLRKLDPPESYGDGAPEDNEQPSGGPRATVDLDFVFRKKEFVKLCIAVAILALVAAIAVYLAPLVLFGLLLVAILIAVVFFAHVLRRWTDSAFGTSNRALVRLCALLGLVAVFAGLVLRVSAGRLLIAVGAIVFIVCAAIWPSVRRR